MSKPIKKNEDKLKAYLAKMAAQEKEKKKDKKK